MRLARTAAAIALSVFGTAGTASAQQFEGVVTIRTIRLSSDVVTEQIGEEPDERAREKLFALTADQLTQLGGAADANVMHYKAGRMRSATFEMPGMGSTYILLDVNGGLMQTVAPSRRGYFEASLRGTATPSAGEQAEAIRIEALGKSQVVNGLRCTGYRVTQGDQVSHVWTTDDAALRELVTGWINMAGDNNESVHQIRSIITRYGAPVMTQEFDDEGNYRVEVWSIERRALPDSLFHVPVGFTKMRTPGN